MKVSAEPLYPRLAAGITEEDKQAFVKWARMVPRDEQEKMALIFGSLLTFRVYGLPEVVVEETSVDPVIADLHFTGEKAYVQGDTTTLDLVEEALNLTVTDVAAKPFGTAQNAYRAAAAMGIDVETYLEG